MSAELNVNPTLRYDNARTNRTATINSSNRKSTASSSLDQCSTVQLVPKPVPYLSVSNVNITANHSSANRRETSTLRMIQNPSHLAGNVAHSLSNLHEHRRDANRAANNTKSVANTTVTQYQSGPANSLPDKTCPKNLGRRDRKMSGGMIYHDYLLLIYRVKTKSVSGDSPEVCTKASQRGQFAI